jgi:hypothetical protein
MPNDHCPLSLARNASFEHPSFPTGHPYLWKPCSMQQRAVSVQDLSS